MRITPIEIRQRQFEKKFRGFDVDEVATYLNTLSNEWERLVEENKELKKRFEIAEREVQKMREVESSLYKTLKTAEDTGNNMIDQANKKAELMTREAQVNAANTIREAKEKAKNMVDEAQTNAKNIIDSAKDELKTANYELKDIENKKTSIIDQLKNIASDINQKVDHYSKPPKIELYNRFAEESVAEVVPMIDTVPEMLIEEEVSETLLDIDEDAIAVTEALPMDEIATEAEVVNIDITNEITETEQATAPAESPTEEVKFDIKDGSFFDQV